MARQFQMQPGGAIVLPTSCVDDEAADANRPLGVSKTRHLLSRGTNFGQLIGDTPTTREMIVHRAKGAETLVNFLAVLEESGTSTNISYDLKKYNDANPSGVSLLSSAVNIVHGTGDRIAVAGTINSPTLAAGDIVTILQTVTSATGASGAWAEVEVDRAYV
jgi:hypothetical protein